MELHKWWKDEKKRKMNVKNDLNFLLSVNQDEAHEIIQSLAEQMRSGSPNVGRKEFQTKDGEYFSIGVHEEDADEATKERIKRAHS